MGVEIYDKPSGVVRGECRGGLGGAAAPNRPPSAPAGGGPNNIKRKAPVPAGHKSRLSEDKPCFILFEAPLRKCRCHYAPCSNSDMQLPQIPHSQRDARLSFRAKAYAGIARRGGRSPSAARKLPEQRPRSPRGMVGYGRPLKASPWECGIYDKPSGVVRGECRGGLGGAAAPNRPPSAARRAGGPN